MKQRLGPRRNLRLVGRKQAVPGAARGNEGDKNESEMVDASACARPCGWRGFRAREQNTCQRYGRKDRRRLLAGQDARGQDRRGKAGGLYRLRAAYAGKTSRRAICK